MLALIGATLCSKYALKLSDAIAVNPAAAACLLALHLRKVAFHLPNGRHDGATLRMAAKGTLEAIKGTASAGQLR
ncbi:MAG: hypothetical protein Rhims3KO_25630 [Hyphomicrobiales bacterium]